MKSPAKTNRFTSVRISNGTTLKEPETLLHSGVDRLPRASPGLCESRFLRVLEYSTDIPEVAVDYRVAQNIRTRGSLCKFVIQRPFEMRQNTDRNAAEILIMRGYNLQDSHLAFLGLPSLHGR